MHVIPRVRLALARRPWLYWVFVALCALMAWAGVRGAVAAAQRRQERWGESRAVMVVATATPRGQPIRASPRQYPAAMVPATAVRSLPHGAVATHDLAAGEVLVTGDLAGDGAGNGSGTGTLPTGWVVFGITSGEWPTLVAGDEVAVFADGTRWCDGIVLYTGTADNVGSVESVDVGVPAACAPSVSAQVATGSVVLARA